MKPFTQALRDFTLLSEAQDFILSRRQNVEAPHISIGELLNVDVALTDSERTLWANLPKALKTLVQNDAGTTYGEAVSLILSNSGGKELIDVVKEDDLPLTIHFSVCKLVWDLPMCRNDIVKTILMVLEKSLNETVEGEVVHDILASAVLIDYPKLREEWFDDVNEPNDQLTLLMDMVIAKQLDRETIDGLPAKRTLDEFLDDEIKERADIHLQMLGMNYIWQDRSIADAKKYYDF